MIDKVLEGVASKKTSIVLMHDGHGEKEISFFAKAIGGTYIQRSRDFTYG